MFIVLLIILLLFVYYNLAEKGHSHTHRRTHFGLVLFLESNTNNAPARQQSMAIYAYPTTPLIAGYEWFVMKIVHSPCFPSFRCAVHLERKIINNGKRMGIVLVSETHTHTARHILHSLDHHRKPSIGLL